MKTGRLFQVKDESREITREELYKLVWSKPLIIAAKEFGISDVGLAKICRRLDVPRPYRGYWQLLEAVRRVSIPRLPPPKNSVPARAFISPYVKPARPLKDNANAALIEIERLPTNRIIVADALHGAHPLIRETRTLLETGFVDSYGRLLAVWSEKPKHVLNVKVSKKSLHRALRIMNALLKAIETRGGEVEVKDRDTLCIMNQAQVRFNLWEKVKRSERDLTAEEREKSYVPDRWIYTPTGEFKFTIDEWVVGRKSWTDKNQKPLEEQLNDIMVGLITASEIIHARDLEHEREERRRWEAERQRQEMERQRRLEEERHQELETMAALWVRSSNLRQFLLECEKALSIDGKLPPDGGEARWLRWAIAYANSIDPLKGQQLYKVIRREDGPIDILS
jgi:hypothetical protein